MEADGVVGVHDAPEERDQQSDLRPAVEPRIAAERPRDAAEVQRAQERVGVAVGADENRDVVVRPFAGGDALGDHRRDLVGLVRGAVEVEVLGCGPLALGRPQSFVDPRGDLEPVGVVVADQPVGGIEDALGRPVVLGEDDAPRLGIDGEEAEHVGDGGPPELVDRVVNHHAVGDEVVRALDLQIVDGLGPDRLLDADDLLVHDAPVPHDGQQHPREDVACRQYQR